MPSFYSFAPLCDESGVSGGSILHLTGWCPLVNGVKNERSLDLLTLLLGIHVGLFHVASFLSRFLYFQVTQITLGKHRHNPLTDSGRKGTSASVCFHAFGPA